MGDKYKGLRVLVVDDYESMRKPVVAILTELGVVVGEALNGLEALSMLRGGQYDVLLTDIVMPEMDGLELCEEVRKSPELLDLPIIVSSTHCDNNYIVKALRCGADDYVPKPVDSALLKRVLARVLVGVPQGVSDE